MLMKHTAQHLREMNQHEAADLLLQKAEGAKRRANLVRQAVMSNEVLSEELLDEKVRLQKESQDLQTKDLRQVNSSRASSDT